MKTLKRYVYYKMILSSRACKHRLKLVFALRLQLQYFNIGSVDSLSIFDNARYKKIDAEPSTLFAVRYELTLRKLTVLRVTMIGIQNHRINRQGKCMQHNSTAWRLHQ